MILTSLILIIFMIFVFAKVQKQPVVSNDFMSYNCTSVLKGICCIVVIFIHVPIKYTNTIQDIIGSFAYICVTIFFMLSAYGVLWNLDNKKNYLEHFLENRFLSLLIPYLIACSIKLFLGFNVNSGGTRFVWVLFLFYLITYFSKKYIKKNYLIIIVIGVLMYSIIGEFTNYGLGWHVESLGFIYGILLKYNIEGLKLFFSKIKISYLTLLVLSIILGCLYLNYKDIHFLGDFILRSCLSISVILLILNTVYIWKFGNSINKMLGKISYEIFLYHGLVINALYYIDTKIIGYDISSGLFIALLIVLTLLLAFLFHIIDNKIICFLKSKIYLRKGEVK